MSMFRVLLSTIACATRLTAACAVRFGRYPNDPGWKSASKIGSRISRRRKQAHDEEHGWIPIRRGLCNLCGKTFTFLPAFSPPYGHYSLIARSQALRRYFLEDCWWEEAAPVLKDPDRVAAPSTLRRWFRGLDSSQPPFSFLRRMMHTISQWFSGTQPFVDDPLPLCWPTVFPLLARFWPLRF
jgi:hypothetical protein